MSHQFSSLQDYVHKLGGKRVIRKILIANNGIAAVKGIRSMKKWAYQTFGKQNVLKFVVMATPEDIKANAEYIRLADEVLKVPGGGTANNYSNINLIVDIAERVRADAVWAGWGHASENPLLPDTLSKTKNKIQFIGPQGKAMRLLGDKISSTLVAEHAGVSTIPWSGTGVKISSPDVTPEEFAKACVQDVESAIEIAKKIGYPLMIKASEGGGGKGIRKVQNEEELKMGYMQVKNEVPGSPIFLMKLATNARHLEVQVVADEYGNAIALHSRDCSIQRRHQKIIEEGPVTVAKREIVKEMEQCAVRLAKCVGYCNAGTVEYLYCDGKYYFLELNPRLQVEHPVTEYITGVNIPATQLQIAMGIPLYRIPDIRQFYGFDPFGDEVIDFEKVEPKEPDGHCIAVRITAENPEAGFRPTTGNVEDLHFRVNQDVWGYFSIKSQSSIHQYSDSQFGHIFAKGKTREEARKIMINALDELSIRGDIWTSVQFVKSLMELEAYINNTANTSTLDELISNEYKTAKVDRFLAVICGALHTLHKRWQANIEKWLWFMQRGQNPINDLLTVDFSMELIYDNIKYCLTGTCSGKNKFTFEMNNSYREAEIRVLNDGALLVLVDRESHISYAREDPEGLRVIIDGKVCQFTKEFDPSKLRATTSGKLVRYLVEDGSKIAAKQPFAELEIMKMIITLYAPVSGRISFKVVEGTAINQGDIIATMDLDDISQVKRAELFEGKFPEERAQSLRPHQILQESIEEIRKLLSGYDYPGTLFDKKLIKAIEGFRQISNKKVLIQEFVEKLSIFVSLIPKWVMTKIENIIQSSMDKNDEAAEMVKAIAQSFTDYSMTLQEAKREEFLSSINPILQLCKTYEGGIKKYALSVLENFAKTYLEVEKVFNRKNTEESLQSLREMYKDNLPKAFDIALSHNKLPRKNKVMVALLREVQRLELTDEFMDYLNEFSALDPINYSEVTLLAKHMIMASKLPSFKRMQDEMESIFHKALQEPNTKDIILNEIIERSNYGFDALLTFFNHSDPKIRQLASEVYIRKAYSTFDVNILKAQEHKKFRSMLWRFVQLQNYFSDSVNRKEGIVGSISTDSLTNMMDIQESEDYTGFGVMVIFESLQDVQSLILEALQLFRNSENSPEHTNVLQIVLMWKEEKLPSDNELITFFSLLFSKYNQHISGMDIHRITVMVSIPEKVPLYYTFRQRLNYKEDPMYRHIEPTLAFQLFLKKMSNYSIQPYPVGNPSVHIYYAEPKLPKKQNIDVNLNRRFFVRTLVLKGDIFTPKNPENFQIAEAESYVVESLNWLAIAMNDKRFKKTYNNHIFINFLPDVVVNTNDISHHITRLQFAHADRLRELNVSEVEVRFKVKPSVEEQAVPLRFIATNKTGYKINIGVYTEVPHPVTGKLMYHAFYGSHNRLHGKDINTPHPLIANVASKRRMAQNYDTSYVYDYPYLFDLTLKQIWKIHARQRDLNPKFCLPKEHLKVVELVLNKDMQLVPSLSKPGQNKYGMVVWRMTLKTPEYPEGRDIIVIANDITFKSGSFGVMEDLIFQRASELARKEKLPRIFITANSGARIGLANEVKQAYQIAWVDDNDPKKGFKYLYITEKDYEHLKESVNCELIEEKGEKRYKIIDIIGKENGIGVENLRGSGTIAGETSQAYKEIFTISYVASRTVGIGAYLVRLGQRVIQHCQSSSPILLTGAGALNKVLGRDVYTSNQQLGGIQIMYNNGVSHLVVTNDFKGILQILKWLSFVPKTIDSPLPITSQHDPIDREIEWIPDASGKQYDPRHLIAGYYEDNDKTKWISGFFDKDSFIETLGGWAGTVVTGRARLGGIPMGVIAVETRTIQQVIPADPADTSSQEQIVQKAGQVWYPDSAFKTAQALRDFNVGEKLPVMIFANWRGFSGGQRDMFNEVLKFGAMIVDALREYKQPVFVYIPPYGELRGGAWAVVDPTINEEVMEMYADSKSKAGILEASGTVEIKYRQDDLINTIRRTDSKYISLTKQLAQPNLSIRQKEEIQNEMKKREKELLPIYMNIAETFCALHDTPGRMKAKNCIKEILEWKNSRTFFYWRLRRKLMEHSLFKRIDSYGKTYTFEQKQQLYENWIRKSLKSSTQPFEELFNDNQKMVRWLEDHKEEIEKRLEILKKEHMSKKILEMCEEDAETAVTAMLNFIKQCEPNKRAQLAKDIRDQLNINFNF